MRFVGDVQVGERDYAPVIDAIRALVKKPEEMTDTECFDTLRKARVYYAEAFDIECDFSDTPEGERFCRTLCGCSEARELALSLTAAMERECAQRLGRTA